MKAAIWTAYGPPEVLQIEQVPAPVPRADQMLVRIVAANVFPGDCELRRFDMHPLYWLPLRLLCGIRKPRRLRILGQELAGEVVAVGERVRDFRPGDHVLSPTTIAGAYAEYIRLRGRHAVIKPPGLSFEAAACLSVGGLNALYFLRAGCVAAGQRVVIHGAGGSIGTMAVQIARAWGAEVTAVDHGDKLPALRKLGAARVVDYTREDFTRLGETYDVIIDVAGKSPFHRSLGCLRDGGSYVHGNASLGTILRRLRVPGSRRRSIRVRVAVADYRREDLAYLVELVQSGRIAPVIDRCYPLEQVVEAHRYVESGRKIGNVVLRMNYETRRGADDG